MTRPTGVGIALCLACALALSACGSSGSATSSSSASSPLTTAHTPTAAIGTVPSTSTTTPSPAQTTSTGPAGTPSGTPSRCLPAALRLSPGAARQASNQYGRTLIFTDISTSSCTLYGYPGVQLLNADGRVLSIPMHRGGGYVFTDPGPHVVVLHPGESASFSFGGPVITAAGGGLCPVASEVRVIPPNDYSQLAVAVRAPACPDSGVTVAAVTAGAG